MHIRATFDFSPRHKRLLHNTYTFYLVFYFKRYDADDDTYTDV